MFNQNWLYIHSKKILFKKRQFFAIRSKIDIELTTFLHIYSKINLGNYLYLQKKKHMKECIENICNLKEAHTFVMLSFLYSIVGFWQEKAFLLAVLLWKHVIQKQGNQKEFLSGLKPLHCHLLLLGFLDRLFSPDWWKIWNKNHILVKPPLELTI